MMTRAIAAIAVCALALAGIAAAGGPPPIEVSFYYTDCVPYTVIPDRELYASSTWWYLGPDESGDDDEDPTALSDRWSVLQQTAIYTTANCQADTITILIHESAVQSIAPESRTINNAYPVGDAANSDVYRSDIESVPFGLLLTLYTEDLIAAFDSLCPEYTHEDPPTVGMPYILSKGCTGLDIPDPTTCPIVHDIMQMTQNGQGLVFGLRYKASEGDAEPDVCDADKRPHLLNTGVVFRQFDYEIPTDLPGDDEPTNAPTTTGAPGTDAPGTTTPPGTDAPGTTTPPGDGAPGTTTPPGDGAPGTTTPPGGGDESTNPTATPTAGAAQTLPLFAAAVGAAVALFHI